MASLISTFLQTAANPAYQQNLLHSLLYKKHILGEDTPSAPNPPPPYFSQTIFDVIRKVKEDSPLNILAMTEKDWGRLLTENFVTLTINNIQTGQNEFTPSKAELDSPATDWPRAGFYFDFVGAYGIGRLFRLNTC